jgi:hypothetical protein
MIRVIAASLLALGGLIAAPVGVANADEIQVNGSYPYLTN